MCSVMKCSRCGHDNDSDALYCVECGLVLNGAHSCKACHNWLNPGYKYCIYCGKKLGEAHRSADWHEAGHDRHRAGTEGQRDGLPAHQHHAC